MELLPSDVNRNVETQGIILSHSAFPLEVPRITLFWSGDVSRRAGQP
jgi:hypothetical protein